MNVELTVIELVLIILVSASLGMNIPLYFRVRHLGKNRKDVFPQKPSFTEPPKEKLK